MNQLSYYWGKFVQLYLTPRIINNCRIDKTSRVCSGSILNNVFIGKYSYIGHKCSINECEIGNMCSIAGECVIGGSAHPIKWVSTSPVFHAEHNVLEKYFGNKHFKVRTKTIIGNDVWLGSRVMIKGGVHIGNGVVIGMGSVVTKDIPPYEIWAGNPAHKIRDRFEKDISVGINRLSWWNLEEKYFQRLAEYIDDPELFLSEFDRIVHEEK